MFQPGKITPIIELESVTRRFVAGQGAFGTGGRGVLAVDSLSLSVMPGETVGVVGESGSGKSTTGRIALGVLRPDTGMVIYKGTDFNKLGREGLREMRMRVSAVFQDPNSSFDPRMNVADLLLEPLKIQGAWRRGDLSLPLDALAAVGLDGTILERYPHEFSGGQRQRIAIARALILGPELVICDEPVSALDPSVQAQAVNLLLDLREKKGLAYLFISHDLRLVKFIAHKVVVLYRGKVVERGPVELVGRDSSHPYSRLLFDSVPGSRKAPKTGPGTVDSRAAEGCVFVHRCTQASGRCLSEKPPFFKLSDRHEVACWCFGRT